MTVHWRPLKRGMTFYQPVAVTLRHYTLGIEHWVISGVPEDQWDRLTKAGWTWVREPGACFVTYSELLAEAESVYFETLIQEA